MSDIEAMKRYLEALAASRQNAAYPQQQQRLQNGPWNPPAPVETMNQPIPTKLNNLRLGQPASLVPSFRTTASRKDEPSRSPIVGLTGNYYVDDGDREEGGEQDNYENSDDDSNPSSTSTHDGYHFKKLMQGSTSTAATKTTLKSLVLPSKSKKNSVGSSLAGHGGLSRFGASEGPIPTRLVHFNDLESDKALLQIPVDKISRLDREERWSRMMARLLESGVLTTRETTPGQLPMTFQPGPLDVVISSNSAGGRQQQQPGFQQLIFCAVPTYQAALECHCPQDIKTLVQTIVQAVSKQGRFVAPIPNCNKATSIPPLWCEVSRNIAERFCLHELKMASHAMAKAQQSMMQGAMRILTSAATPSATSRNGRGDLKMAPLASLPASRKVSKASSAVALMQAHTQVPTSSNTANAPPPTPSSMFARRITPPDIALPQIAELWEGCGSGKTSPSALDLLSEAAFRVDAVSKRKQATSNNAGGEGDDDEANYKQRRISVNTLWRN